VRDDSRYRLCSVRSRDLDRADPEGIMILAKIIALWFMFNAAFFVAMLPNLRAPARETSIADARRRIALVKGAHHHEQ
jgi:hypothetical protein